MFKNYLAAALRNLARNRLYAGINIVGLAVGFAAAILIALFVRDELTFDRWIPGHERIYLVSTVVRNPGQAPIEMGSTYPNIAEALKSDFSQIEAVARLYGADVDLRVGNAEAEEHAYWADPDIFSVLPFKSIAGDLKTALERPDSAVLDRTTARKYFGRDDAVGETIDIDHQHPMRVAAVIEDFPSNTHLKGDIFLSARASISPLSLLDAMRLATDQTPWLILRAETYLRLAPGASVDVVQHALPVFITRHIPPEVRNDRELQLLPVGEVHLHPAFGGTERRDTIYAISGIGILVVLVASINFINLMTARGARRAIEVGVRKVAGASRRNLVVQFIGEALIYAGLGMTVAIAQVELLLPSFNAFLDRTIAFDYWQEPVAIGEILGLLALVGMLAGLYPAVVLSAFRPATVLKSGLVQTAGSGTVRQILVVLQFTILIGLILATGVVYRQTEYAMNEFLRFDHDQVLLINGTSCSDAFENEIRVLPGVQAAACSWSGGILNNGYVTGLVLPDGTKTSFRAAPVDFGFLDLYGLKPLAGRVFSPDHPTDMASPDRTSVNPGIVINETALHRLGFASPELAIGQTIRWQRMLASREFVDSMEPSEIIGVVADIPSDIRYALRPGAYYVDPSLFLAIASYSGAVPTGTLHVKLSGRDVPETLASIDRVWRERGDPRPIQRVFLDQQLQSDYLEVTRQGQMFAVFAGVAVFIACLGLFGLSAFTAERRTKEIGIRKAMGASRLDIVRLLVWQFSKPVLLANLIAWPVGYYFMNRWLHGFAYHVDLSPWIFLAAGTAALIIALATVSIHAFLVARAKPVTALRYE